MSDLPPEELRARLRAIATGPWAKGLAEVRARLTPPEPVAASFRGVRSIALDQIRLSPANRRRSRRLEKTLRLHFAVKGDRIEDPGEIDTRDAFDQALTLPQLWELAVQTGYLPEAVVRKPARNMLTELLWSEPARRFVVGYDYVSVPLLARRVGVSGIEAVSPPPPNPAGALHFAGFLAHLRAFHGDEQIETWIKFLDDYVDEEGEQTMVWEYFQGKRATAPVRAPALAAGCLAFVSSLASAFDVLSDDELGPFGLIHMYWLMKFFGYERNSSGGFVKDVDTWGRSDSWASTMMRSNRLVPSQADPDIGKVVRQRFEDQVHVLERTFQAVVTLATNTRAGIALGQPANEGLSPFLHPRRPSRQRPVILE